MSATIASSVQSPRGGSPTVESSYEFVLRHTKALRTGLVPYMRRLLRFVALPYCYFFLVNWRECSASPIRVASDLLYIFFRLKYFPDNYSPCRLWDVDRSDWPLYYGSFYDPYQRRQLQREVMPPEYQVLFTDKEVSQRICEGLGLPVPALHLVVGPRDDYRSQIRKAVERSSSSKFILKPARGIGGRDVYIIRAKAGEVEVFPTSGKPHQLSDLRITERMMLQEHVPQDPILSAVYPGAVNTLRVQTLLTLNDEVILLGAAARFGRGGTRVDNVSTGGIGVGVDVDSGVLMRCGMDFGGREYTRHPESGVVFEGFAMPKWNEIVQLVTRAQKSIPYYRLLGFDIAVSTNGPVIIEINSLPDNVGLEGSQGPILARDRTILEFDRYDLLINELAKRIARRKSADQAVAGRSS